VRQSTPLNNQERLKPSPTPLNNQERLKPSPPEDGRRSFQRNTLRQLRKEEGIARRQAILRQRQQVVEQPPKTPLWLSRARGYHHTALKDPLPTVEVRLRQKLDKFTAITDALKNSDSDRTGVVRAKEFKEALRIFGLVLSEKDITQVAQQVDGDGKSRTHNSLPPFSSNRTTCMRQLCTSTTLS
jgi:hypothetical protein